MRSAWKAEDLPLIYNRTITLQFQNRRFLYLEEFSKVLAIHDHVRNFLLHSKVYIKAELFKH